MTEDVNPKKLTGGCLCGQINYEISGLPAFSMMCQCSQCQHITGTGHSAQFAVDADIATIQGDLNHFEITAESGNTVTSLFCGNCGNPIYKTTSMMPDKLMFHVGSLDDPSNYRPDMLVYSAAGHDWDLIDPEIPRK